MANVPEQPTYDPGVYQLEVTDPVLGGLGGVANAQAVNLANRTNYLKQRLDSLIAGNIIPPTVAPLNGPNFTGSTTAPNVAPGDDSTLIANTDFVQTAKHGLVVVTLSGGATVTLTQPQWGCAMISFVGVLTANVSVIFPSRPGNWIVANGCTGTINGVACTITCRLASGTGGSVVLQQFPNQFNAIWTDGVGVFPQISPFLLALTQPLVIGALGYVPVQQGGGTNQSTNKVYIGRDQADAGHLRAQVETVDLGQIALQVDVASEASTRLSQDNLVASNAQTALNAEIATRFANDSSVATNAQNQLNSEISTRFTNDQAILSYVNANCGFLANNQSWTGGNVFTSAMFPNAGYLVGTGPSNPISHGSNGLQTLGDGSTQIYHGSIVPFSVGSGFAGNLVSFFNGATPIGSIGNVGASVSFNQTCDYRIKIIHGMADEESVGAIFDATPVRDAEYRDTGLRRLMFLAHELQSGVPSVVSGDKDAEQDIGELVTTKDGTTETAIDVPIPAQIGHDQEWRKTGRGMVLQQVDHSALAPYLWAEIRFLREREKARARRERALEARLAALEARP